MGNKSPPPAPDYTAAAERQAQSSREVTNMQTWANRPNTFTPWGSQTWSMTPGGTRTIAGNANNGAQFDAARYLRENPDVAQAGMSAIDHWEKHGQGEGRQGFWQDVEERLPDHWTQRVELSADQQAALDSQMAITKGRSQGAQTLLDQAVSSFQRPMDWDALPRGADSIDAGTLGQNDFGDPRVRHQQGPQDTPLALYGGGDPNAPVQQLQGVPNEWRQRGQDAVWELQRPMLDQEQQALEAQLANQGLSRGTAAWNNEMRRMGDQRSRAQLQAISAGRDEASQLFNQELGRSQFANQAAQQSFGNRMANSQFFNQAMNQRFSQDAARRQFENQATQLEFENMNRRAMMGDQRAAQQLQMRLQAGNFNNTNRQQAIAEANMRRGQVLNELNALLTGQQVSMPSMPSFNTAGRADATGYSAAARDQYSAAMDGFNAQQQQSQGMMSGLFALGGAAIGGPMGASLGASLGGAMGSLREYKQNVRIVGYHTRLDIPIYAWEYRPEYAHKWGSGTKVGVMVEDLYEVDPQAITKDADGDTVVNYERIWQ